MTNKENKITINTVAKRAGVSKSTVSRYLNGKSDSISKDKRENIKLAIEELDYKPNRLAQSLKSKTSGVIGCIVSNIGSPFSSILVKGINQECLLQGYQLILTDSEDNKENEKKAINSLMERSVDGLIINSTGENDEFILNLSKKGFPIVLADRPLSIPGNIDTVLTDNGESVKKALLYLKKVGYTKVALFGVAMNQNEVRWIRYYSFCKYETEIFGSQDSSYVYIYNDLDDCKKKINHFISNNIAERVAILTINGVSLLDVLKVIKNSTGIKIGQEMGICSFDNWGWADLVGPGITTITQNTWGVGLESAKLLFKKINSEIPSEPTTKIINNILEIRGSTVSLWRLV